ncbi:hypothetical protein EIM50_13700 [Pseudoxanthomonas sp. SGD-10]|nr:hypothetical protein EIM50_13700 [Pseudoxanthomonas sp. SGD-10]
MCHLTRLDFRPHPTSEDIPVYVRSGQTLQQMLLEASRGQPIHDDIVVYDPLGHEVPRHLWPHLTPRAGAVFQVVNYGIHGSGARNVLMIAVAAAAMWVTGGAAAGLLGSSFAAGTFGAAALGAGVMVGGTMLVDKLVPLPMPTASGGVPAQWNQITGMRNSVNLWGTVPCVLGEDVIYPPYAAAPYSEVVGEKSYHYYLFDLGYGDDMLVDQLEIYGTPIAEFDEVTYSVTRTPTMFVNTVLEDAVNASMNDDNDEVIRTTEDDTDRISLDIRYPGLFGTGTSGKDFSMYTGWSISYRPHGDEDAPWQVPTTASRSRFTTVKPQKASSGEAVGVDFWVNEMKKNPFGASLAWDVPRGRYDVRVKRVISHRGSASNTYVDQATWSALRSIRKAPPTTTDTNMIEMRILASGRLTGFIDGLRCRVRQKIPVYDADAGTWSAPTFTTNAAWVTYWHMTRNPALKRRATDAEMLLDEWVDFAEHCETHGLQARMTVDVRQPNREVIAKLLGAGMASLGKRDGKWLPVFDRGDIVPRMSFSQKDMRDFQIETTHRDIPHAVRVTFKNPLEDYREDEMIVLDDGYSYRGLDARGNPSSAPAPTRWEHTRLEMSVLPQQAWMLLRYQLAQARYRPYVASWSSGRSGLRVVRGDAVRVSHDTVEWGKGAGFVTDVVPGGYGGAVATVRLDETIGTNAGKTHQMQVRRRLTGETYVMGCVPHSTYTDTFYITALPPKPDGSPGTMALAEVVGQGDVAVIGESENVSEVLLVTGVTYPELLRPAFTAVAYDPRITPFWTDPPENIPTALATRASVLPAPPEVIGVASSVLHDQADDAGIIGPMIRIGVRQRSRSSASAAETAAYDVRWRIASEDDEFDWNQRRVPVAAAIDLRDGIMRETEYEGFIRSVAPSGAASEWVPWSVEVPGTAREGVLALPASVAANIGIWDVDISVNWSADTTSATISVSSGTYVIAGRTINYGSSSVAVSGAPGTTRTFYLYYNDPQLAGGTRTLHASETYVDMRNGDGRVPIDGIPVTFPTSGTSTGGGGIGGGFTCPAVEAWVFERDRGLIRAGDVRAGDWLLMPGGRYGEVTYSATAQAIGVRVVTTGGRTLTCSETAPILTVEGYVPAAALLGCRVDVSGTVCAIEAVETLGVIAVQHITLGGEGDPCFLVGDRPDALFPHHNRKMLEDPMEPPV